MKNLKFIFPILISLSVFACFINFRDFTYDSETFLNVQDITSNAIYGILKIFNLSQVEMFLRKVPFPLIVFLITAIVQLIGYWGVVAFGKRIEKSYFISQKDMKKIAKRGAVFLVASLSLITIFAYSIIGIPIAIFLFIVQSVVVFIGSISVAINIGSLVQEYFNGDDRKVENNYILGVLVMLIGINVYVVRGFLAYLVIPVMSLGVVWCALENKYLNNNIKNLEIDDKRKNFDKEKMRELITKGL